MSTAEPYDDPADRADHPQRDCSNCGHASDCSTHNEPALPAGPCDCRKGQILDHFATGGLIHGERLAIVGKDDLEVIIPLPAWKRSHERARLFDGAATSTPAPTLSGLTDFVQPLIRQMLDRQIEQQASLPPAPDGYRWEIITEWPRFDVAIMHDVRVTWRWVLRAVDGSDQ